MFFFWKVLSLTVVDDYEWINYELSCWFVNGSRCVVCWHYLKFILSCVQEASYIYKHVFISTYFAHSCPRVSWSPAMQWNQLKVWFCLTLSTNKIGFLLDIFPTVGRLILFEVAVPHWVCMWALVLLSLFSNCIHHALFIS